MTQAATGVWDIFCKVIDNFGDIGVCWRLAADLSQRGHHVRLWVDDASSLAWMAPQGAEGVQVLTWADPLVLPSAELALHPTDVLIEAFGCDVPPLFLAAAWAAAGTPPVWINLEYLSAENYVARCHGLASPVQTGPAAGALKWFFYPGFTAQTGGLLREASLLERQACFDRVAWLRAQSIACQAENAEILVSLFCYEPPALADSLRQWAQAGWADRPVHLLVTAGRAAHALAAALQHDPALQRLLDTRQLLRVSQLGHLSQLDFDHLLWACDLNAVRGEDSLVRALWAGKPLLWNIYPQQDGVHQLKLEAFLDGLQAPDSLRQLHRVWNGAQGAACMPDAAQWRAWQDCMRQARQRLLAQDDLTTQLCQWVAEKSLKSSVLRANA